MNKVLTAPHVVISSDKVYSILRYDTDVAVTVSARTGGA